MVPTIKLARGAVCWAKVALPAEELLRAKKMLTIKEVCWILGDISRSQVYYMVNAGQLDAGAYRPLRITSASVSELLAQSEA
jgi:predicted DNA-binding transcriptional regulator AlpA